MSQPFKLNLKKPLVVFDLETTGTQIVKDRIVEMTFIKITPQGDEEELFYRINPTIPIPKVVSLIHGIYDKDVENEPTFKEVSHTLFDWLKGCDLAGFNVLHFDLPILTEEFLRCELDFSYDKRNIVDSQKIFHLMEKRNLSAAYRFYCDKDLVDAHSSRADTRATYEVLLSQIQKYDQRDVVDSQGNKLGKIENNLDSLNRLTENKFIDITGRIVEKNGQKVFNFGKYKGQSVSEVFKTDPSYYNWMMNSDFSLDTKRKITKIKLEKFGS